MKPDENERRIRERKLTWWTQVLAGPVDDTYPAPGAHVIATLEGDTRVVSGIVATEQDRREIEVDVNSLIGNGIAAVRIELEVSSESTEEQGLLTQTLVGVFESEAQARFAASYLSSQEELHPTALLIVAPEKRNRSAGKWHRLLPKDYWKDVDEALSASRSVVIVTVDETLAFRAREILEEETRSQQTWVLPPVPASGRPAARG